MFLGAGLRTGSGGPLAIEGPGRAKVIGNGLRELDRFLNLLIDEVAALIAPAGIDRVLFAQQRNTANKLRAIRAAMALPNPDHDRLRAVGRSRNCLFHCAGIVGRNQESFDFATPIVEGRLVMTPAQLKHICRFYERVAAELLVAVDAFTLRYAA